MKVTIQRKIEVREDGLTLCGPTCPGRCGDPKRLRCRIFPTKSGYAKLLKVWGEIDRVMVYQRCPQCLKAEVKK